MRTAGKRLAEIEASEAESRHGPVEYADELANTQTSYDVFRVLKDVCKQYGYRNFIALNLPVHNDTSFNSQILVTNWNPELIRACDTLELSGGNTLISQVRKSSLPFSYDIESSETDFADNLDQETVSLLRQFDQPRGVYIPCIDRNGRRGFVGYTGSDHVEADRALADLNFISIHAYERLSNFEEAAKPVEGQLTDRERDCVLWTSTGKTSAETGEKLGISENTVNHYLSSAAAKLGTANKAHTVAEALRRGLLSE